MAFQKKVIILSDADSKGGTGIVKLTRNGDSTTVSVLLHNTGEGKKQLYLSVGGEFFKFDILGNSILSLGKKGLSEPLDCMVTDGTKPMLFGSTGCNKYRCFNLSDEYTRQNAPYSAEISQIENKVETKELAEKNAVETEETAAETVQIIENEMIEAQAVEAENEEENAQILEEETPTKCGEKTCVTVKKKPKVDTFEEGIVYTGDNFYIAIKPQLDEMFICYPTDKALAEIVPNSKWVRVAMEEDYYVVGVIFELDEPRYICYGIHGYFDKKPTDDLALVSEWLPLNLNNAEGEGYWMIYQSAADGKTLKKE